MKEKMSEGSKEQRIGLCCIVCSKQLRILLLREHSTRRSRLPSLRTIPVYLLAFVRSLLSGNSDLAEETDVSNQRRRLTRERRGTIPSKILGGGDGDVFVPSKNFRNI